MRNNHQQTKLAERFRESMEQAQERLNRLEAEAQKMFQDVVERSKASRKEMTHLLAKLNAGELFDSATMKEIQGRARDVRADVVHRFDDLRNRAIAYTGVASRDQVDELARDVEKLTRKIDRLLGPKRTPHPKQ